MIDGDGTLPNEAPMNSHGLVTGSYAHPDVRMTMEVWVDPGLPVYLEWVGTRTSDDELSGVLKGKYPMTLYRNGPGGE
ncbi:MAG: hypothetical protein OXQ94_08645 [Gemmatimonadota bacterium]|nr:hypothetical protein [Gemmatimonadota bacterium]MDE2871737.1 hypothetical protein [Gemmatimonadota bacterium]